MAWSHQSGGGLEILGSLQRALPWKQMLGEMCRSLALVQAQGRQGAELCFAHAEQLDIERWAGRNTS